MKGDKLLPFPAGSKSTPVSVLEMHMETIAPGLATSALQVGRGLSTSAVLTLLHSIGGQGLAQPAPEQTASHL